ncbi:MAG TPA: hypothetical protein VFI68_11770, partial [Anaerolineales bacterium]|nr:hypothetical protein [Anaerolineales bacterium]
MSQPNRKYKRLEDLLSESKPAEPNPIAQPESGDVDALKARVASLQAELEENRKKQAGEKQMEAREAHPAGLSGIPEKNAPIVGREMASRSLTARESQAAAAKQNSMNDQPSRQPGKSSPARNAYRVLLALFAAQFMVVGFLVYQTIQTPSWQLWVMDLLGGGLMMSEIFGLVLTRRGRHEFGIKFFLSFFMFVLLVIPFIYSGMG